MKYLAQQVVFALLTSQVKENKLLFFYIPTFGSYRAQTPVLAKSLGEQITM